ncbi:Pkinase-domain-containing protein, partial [Hyphopichia burtonii NRRL Y-1933]
MDVSHLSIENEGSSNRKIINNTYRILKKIGQGQFGKVMLAENKSIEKSPKNKYVAIKTINRIDKTRLITKTYLSHTTKIKREIQIMKGCKHPNVVQLYQVIDDLKYDKILLVLEYCKYGEVDWKNYNHYHEKHNKNGEGLTLNKLLRDVINGLEYLHDYKHIIHRDLKPSNLLISADKTIKISDFGVSLILENNANDDKELGKTMGTPAFFAPELCQFVNNRLSMLNDADRAKSKIDNKIDLWSLGVILYCLVFHNLPFNGNNEFSLFKKIVTEPLKFPQIKKSSRTTLEDVNELKLLKDLINKLLIKDPKQRMTIKDIKQHAFTTFDLQNSKQISEFVEFNKKLISNQNKPISNETGLATKIRRFFSNKPEPSPAPPNHDIIQQQKEHEINEQKLLNDPTSLSNLEPVDDLLNSYFDDSSSMGSLEKEEVEPYDTSEVLRSLNDDNLKEQDNTLKNPSFESKNKVGVPPPLKIKDSFHEKKSNSDPSLNTITTAQKTPLSTQTFNHSPIMTPGTTNDEIITIGAGSPSSIKSMISPSRRFFSRSKKSTKLQSAESEKKPTISSLSSPEKKPKERLQNTKKFTDLMEPPPIFDSISLKVFNESPKNVASPTCSRKNSVSSSIRSVGLTRIASSTSSLNLNAYLTDDAFSLSSTTKSKHKRLSLLSSSSSLEDTDVDDDNDEDDDDDDDGNNTTLNDEDHLMNELSNSPTQPTRNSTAYTDKSIRRIHSMYQTNKEKESYNDMMMEDN